jgi:hypothetical protein
MVAISLLDIMRYDGKNKGPQNQGEELENSNREGNLLPLLNR